MRIFRNDYSRSGLSIRSLWVAYSPSRWALLAGMLAVTGGLLGAGCKGSQSMAGEVTKARLCTGQMLAARRELLSAGRAVVPTQVVDLLERPQPQSTLADQAVLGDILKILPETSATACAEPEGLYLRVETESGYHGYAAVAALVPWRATEPYRAGAREQVVTRFANIYPQPNLTVSNPWVVAPLGTELRRVAVHDARWLKVLLPDGKAGFVQRGDVVSLPAESSAGGAAHADAACVVNQGLLHEGTPYLWGGRSTFGIDCSGLVVNSYLACGILLPRDARLQYEWAQAQKVTPEKDVSALQPGDMVFFTSVDVQPSAHPKITHVGLYVGAGSFVHATTSERPTVHRSLLTEPEWSRRWVGSRRYSGLHDAAGLRPAEAAKPAR